MTVKKSQTIEIRLLGQKIALKTGGDPDFVSDVVELVSQRIAVAEKRVKSLAPHHVALLALMDLAEEYVQAKRRAADHVKAMDEKSSGLLSLIETEFK